MESTLCTTIPAHAFQVFGCTQLSLSSSTLNLVSFCCLPSSPPPPHLSVCPWHVCVPLTVCSTVCFTIRFTVACLASSSHEQNDISDVLDLTFSMDADEEKHILYEKAQVRGYG